jgi:hypothetical protein
MDTLLADAAIVYYQKFARYMVSVLPIKVYGEAKYRDGDRWIARRERSFESLTQLRVGYPKVRYYDQSGDVTYIGFALYGSSVYTPGAMTLSACFANSLDMASLLRRKTYAYLSSGVLSHHL